MRRWNPEWSTFSEVVRGLREGIGLSQAQLASRADLSQGYMSQIENDGVQNPSAAVFHRLAVALGVNPRALMRAGGYEEVGEELVDESEFPVLLELLRFLARFSSDYQTVIYVFLRGFTGAVKETPDEKEAETKEGGRIEPVTTRRSRKPKGKLGDKIISLRGITRITQGKLAISADLSQGHLSQLENGDVKKPSVATLLRLAAALDIPADDLFEAAGYLTMRRLRDEYHVLESQVLPRLREFLAGLSLSTQQQLLGHLRDIEDVVVSAGKIKSTAANTEKAALPT